MSDETREDAADVVGAPEELDADAELEERHADATTDEAFEAVEDGAAEVQPTDCASRIEFENDIRLVPNGIPLVSGKLVGNPNYRPETYTAADGTEYSVVSDWEPGPHLREKEAVFFLNLEESIQREGVKYPACGFGINGRIYLKTGLSRVWAARKYEAPCPVLVVDLDGSFERFERVLDVREQFPGRAYRDNVAPGLGWYYTHLDDRPSMDDPRFIKDLF